MRLLFALFALLALPTAAALPAPDVHWRFNEADGQDIFDSGPAGVHGFLGSSPSDTVLDPTRLPGAIGLGSGTYATVPNHAALEPATITLAIEFDAPSNPGFASYFVAKGGSGGCDFASWAMYTQATATFYLHTPTPPGFVEVSATTDVFDGQPHLLVGTFDGSTMRIYVDGVLEGTRAEAGPILYGIDTNDMLIGDFPTHCTPPFAGTIGDVRIWGEALDGTQIQPADEGAVEPVPELGSLALVAAGMVAAVLVARRRL